MSATFAHVTGDRKRAGAYLRISQDREGRELGVDRQLEQCRALADRLGWHIAEVYTDNDSGASRYSRKRRPDYERMLAAARAGQIAGIVALSTSRLTRRPRELEDLVDLVDEHGTEIHTAKVGRVDLATAQGRMLARILAAADAAEAEVNSERSRDERAQRRARGLPNGGTRPFGWQANGIDPHPTEMPALRRAVEEVIGGKPLRAVARDWSAVKGTRVQTATVRRVLLSERIRGRLPDGQPAVWAAVATEEEGAALRGVLNRPAPTQNAVQLLTGWALCGVCRSPVRGGVNRLGVGCYECRERPHLRLPREPRDEFVRQLVAEWLDRERLAADVDTRPLQTRLAAIAVQLEEVADMLVAGELDRAQAARATDRLRTQRAAVEVQLAEVAARAAAPATGAAFLSLDTAAQRSVLALLPWRVVMVSPGRGSRSFDPESVLVIAR